MPSLHVNLRVQWLLCSFENVTTKFSKLKQECFEQIRRSFFSYVDLQ